ncbi:MAG TPA: hypothetical protein VH857_09375 [Actinomycetes bacterium]|jgi:hypothetical protein|nr:hypothetical protein [Actinomycetes bacterium]
MEFSTTDILFLLSVAAGIVLAVWAPGWVALGWVVARRHRARTGTGGFWAFAGGAVTGVAVSIAVAGATWRLTEAVGGGGRALALSVPLSWAACWLVAWGVGQAPRRVRTPYVRAEGWGR